MLGRTMTFPSIGAAMFHLGTWGCDSFDSYGSDFGHQSSANEGIRSLSVSKSISIFELLTLCPNPCSCRVRAGSSVAATLLKNYLNLQTAFSMIRFNFNSQLLTSFTCWWMIHPPDRYFRKNNPEVKTEFETGWMTHDWVTMINQQ